jgi:hypothetical protein
MRTYWKSHYVTEVDPNDIERSITLASLTSGGASHELVCFLSDRDSPNVLVSQGSGGHASMSGPRAGTRGPMPFRRSPVIHHPLIPAPPGPSAPADAPGV